MSVLSKLAYLPRDQVNQIINQIYMSDDEKDILDLILHGKSSQEIALTLRMSERTVYRRKDSLTNKLRKLNF